MEKSTLNRRGLTPGESRNLRDTVSKIGALRARRNTASLADRARIDTEIARLSAVADSVISER
jgi:hypothetical protein